MTEVTALRVKLADETSSGASGIRRSLDDIKRQAFDTDRGLDRLKRSGRAHV